MSRRPIVPSELGSFVDDWTMSPGVLVSGGLLYLTGMTGTRPDGSIATDPESQIRDAFENVRLVLDEAGGDMSSIVEMTSYHVGLHDHLELFRAVRAELVTEPYPAWTAVEVAGLVPVDGIVELRIVAEIE